MNCKLVIWIIISNVKNAGGAAQVSESDLKKSNTELWRDKDLFSFRISS
jgi:hypothetical protein